MSVNNIVSSISYLEFINQINSLANELLYSPEKGYINLNSKEAIENYQNIIDSFNQEALKIAKKVNFSNAGRIIENKKKDLILAIQKHYDSQVPLWAQEVFDIAIDNLLFELLQNKEKAQIIWNQIIEAIDWIVNIQKLDESSKNALKNKIEKDFIKTLNSKDSDFMPTNMRQDSDYNEFVKNWNKILEDENEFLSLDFFKMNDKLTQKDISYFENIKNKFSTFRKMSQIDELNLIQSAIKHLKLKESKEIYDFISQINNDFVMESQNNKMLLEEDKIKLLKRRIALFSDKSATSKEYFDKLINSSLNE